jgi:hypothetical protein
VRDNWIYNVVGGAIKPIWANQNLVIENNRDSESRIVPPFEKELGPEGTATHGIDLAKNRLTGSVIHHDDKKQVKTGGKWTPRTVDGMWGLFRFDYLSEPPPTRRKPPSRCRFRKTELIRSPCCIPLAKIAPATCPSRSYMPTARRS